MGVFYYEVLTGATRIACGSEKCHYMSSDEVAMWKDAHPGT
jgi:hypothetical protein